MSVNVSALEVIEDSTLDTITGQAGADISLKMQLNHDANNSLVCSNRVYCRLGISLNNRYHDGSADTFNANDERIPSATGRQQWVVFKGIQGTINITKMTLDGIDLEYTKVGGATQKKAALNLGFTTADPIQIRNFGFESMSIETDTHPNANSLNTSGYLVPVTGTQSSLYTVAGFDNGKERGFLGLNMNANLALNGSIKIFSCAGGTHIRC